MAKKLKFETLQLHVGQEKPDPATGARAVPIYQTTSFVFPDSETAAARFALTEDGNIYTRIMNPTTDVFEKRVAALEGGVGALALASGLAAVTAAVRNIAGAGDHIVAAAAIYGGTYTLFAHHFNEIGIETAFVDGDDPANFEKAIRPNTKLLYTETLGNPNSNVADIRAIADVAHKHGIPLIIDNTFATPILCKPISFGADIVVHSTSKYMDGHAVQVGGAIVDSGNFDWRSGNFPELTEPDESYHGTVYVDTYGKAAYIVKARMQLMRDFGAYPAAHSAFLLNMGLETLAIRMDRYCENAMKVAEFLQAHPKIASVNYPGLPSDPSYALAQKYLKGTSGVISMVMKGGKANAVKFMDSLKMASNEVHVCDIRTCVLHPASETHRQLTDEQLVACGINPGMVRLSVGLENIDDILEDVGQALERV